LHVALASFLPDVEKTHASTSATTISIPKELIRLLRDPSPLVRERSSEAMSLLFNY
jgi:hypothetical protein